MRAGFGGVCGIAAALVACGMPPANAPDVEAYQRLVADTRTTVEQHRASGAVATSDRCSAERDRYAAQLGAELRDMRTLSGSMDACMGAMGHGGDLGPMCSGLQDELARHLAALCTGTADEARAELARHCDAMEGGLGRMSREADELSGPMGEMMSGGSCHR